MRISLQSSQASPSILFHNDEKKSRDKEEHIHHEKTQYNKNFKNKAYKKENNRETILEYIKKEYAPYIKLRKRKNKYTEEDLLFSKKG
ncbi:MAG: hypothetical protein E7307_03530 [Butyrivibrio sp.]|nr:hypothetical protein [Butyrivibrio sp.]